MIGFLTGVVKFKTNEGAIILTGGVGYQVALALSTLAKLVPGQPAALFIYTHIREENFDLYGFATQEELTLFKHLLGVSGIGPKTALLVMDKGVDQIRQAIVKADTGFFTLIPRLGTKNAQKIIIELKSKLGSLTEVDLRTPADSETTEIIDALTGMCYTRSEAIQAVRQIPPTLRTIEEKIKFALKNTMKRPSQT
jgi:Holliday junction DNA helicase RuvA